MATCMECLYFKRCVSLGVELNIKQDKEADKNCRHFKNKADYAEVKHGHWIWLEGNLYECSECPNKTEVDEAMNQPLYEFCPYCGAKMDGGAK